MTPFFNFCIVQCQMVTFLLSTLISASSCVPSKNLGQTQNRQSHTGCISLIFLQCAFSNVPSNYLPERMHSYTGCICLAFPHYALSNVSSNYLPERRYIHTGCICEPSYHQDNLCHDQYSLLPWDVSSCAASIQLTQKRENLINAIIKIRRDIIKSM